MLHSTRRTLDASIAYPVTKGRCRVCGRDIPKGRQTTCGNDCVETLRITCWPNSQRFHVEQRDKGVCAKCGCDTKVIERVLRHTRDRSARTKYLEGIGFGAAGLWRSLWECDHIVPVIEGGGVKVGMTKQQVLENLRTLCRACHKQETAALARRRVRE